MKSQMRRADKKGARFAAVIGETELAAGAVRLKDLRSGEMAGDEALRFDALPEEVRRLLSKGDLRR